MAARQRAVGARACHAPAPAFLAAPALRRSPFRGPACLPQVPPSSLFPCSGTPYPPVPVLRCCFRASEGRNFAEHSLHPPLPQILALGLLFTSLVVVRARSWRLLRPLTRGLLADYGVPLAVLVWALAGYIIGGPTGVPRTVSMANTWSDAATQSWTVSSVSVCCPFFLFPFSGGWRADACGWVGG